MEKDLINILAKLISFKSITPIDDGCQLYIGNYLENLGFTINKKKYGEVDNLIAHRGSTKPVVAFLGHTDVVPVGDIKQWSNDPFKLTKNNGKFIARGVSDMKGSIACMLLAIKNFIKKNPNHKGTIVMILTSDEEGPAINGVQKLIQNNVLQEYGIDMCLIGEPTSRTRLGDTIKNGRRGSLSGKILIKGQQGHIAYPQNAINPIHQVSPIISELITKKYDEGDEFFPPTSFQISNIHSGIGADNVIPNELILKFNFRYSPKSTKEALISSVEQALTDSGVSYEIEWHHSGDPYLTSKRELLDICSETIDEILSIRPNISTDGGTSDGRFLAKICNQVIEFGLLNESIHKINENAKEKDLVVLAEIYERLLSKLFDAH